MKLTHTSEVLDSLMSSEYSDLITTIYLKQIYKFNIFLEKDCLRLGIVPPSFSTWLLYEHDGMYSPAYTHLYKLPLIYLANSHAFSAYYRMLDKDFRQDLFTAEQWKTTQKFLKRNEKFKIYLRKIMGEDSVY